MGRSRRWPNARFRSERTFGVGRGARFGRRRAFACCGLRGARGRALHQVDQFLVGVHVELRVEWLTWVFTVLYDTVSSSWIKRTLRPRARYSKISCSRSVSPATAPMAAHRSAMGDSRLSPALDDTSDASGSTLDGVREAERFLHEHHVRYDAEHDAAAIRDVVVASAAISFVNRPKLAPSSVPQDAMALPQASIGSAFTVFFAPSAMSTKYMRISKTLCH